MKDPINQGPTTKHQIDFVLVLVRDDSKMATNIGAICSVAERSGMEFDLFGSLITLTREVPPDETSRRDRAGRLIAELSRCLGGAAKILHGSDMGHPGRMVGQKQVRFSIMLPHFTEARHQVDGLEWGQVLEFGS